MSLSRIPLTNEQKKLPSGALLPSGEANFFDFRQDYSVRNGQGINTDYPNPFFTGSGSALIATKPSDSGIDRITTTGVNLIGSGEKGILTYNNVSGLFSNAVGSLVSGITDFTIFNPYIHYYGVQTRNVRGVETVPVTIPYLSDYTAISGDKLFDVYNNTNYQYYTYNQLFGNI
jgi:hypothetical protein